MHSIMPGRAMLVPQTAKKSRIALHGLRSSAATIKSEWSGCRSRILNSERGIRRESRLMVNRAKCAGAPIMIEAILFPATDDAQSLRRPVLRRNERALAFNAEPVEIAHYPIVRPAQFVRASRIGEEHRVMAGSAAGVKDRQPCFPLRIESSRRDPRQRAAFGPLPIFTIDIQYFCHWR